MDVKETFSTMQDITVIIDSKANIYIGIAYIDNGDHQITFSLFSTFLSNIWIKNLSNTLHESFLNFFLTFVCLKLFR